MKMTADGKNEINFIIHETIEGRTVPERADSILSKPSRVKENFFKIVSKNGRLESLSRNMFAFSEKVSKKTVSASAEKLSARLLSSLSNPKKIP